MCVQVFFTQKRKLLRQKKFYNIVEKKQVPRKLFGQEQFDSVQNLDGVSVSHPGSVLGHSKDQVSML
jgi:hypothetical protein